MRVPLVFTAVDGEGCWREAGSKRSLAAADKARQRLGNVRYNIILSSYKLTPTIKSVDLPYLLHVYITFQFCSSGHHCQLRHHHGGSDKQGCKLKLKETSSYDIIISSFFPLSPQQILVRVHQQFEHFLSLEQSVDHQILMAVLRTLAKIGPNADPVFRDECKLIQFKQPGY